MMVVMYFTGGSGEQSFGLWYRARRGGITLGGAPVAFLVAPLYQAPADQVGAIDPRNS